MTKIQEQSEQKKEAFSFCVGRPWPYPDNGICTYAYGSEVHHGTMEDAQRFRNYVEEQTGEKSFIYKLVQLPEDR